MEKQGWIPEGSTIQENPNDTMTIIPPADWIYAGTPEGGGATYIAAGGQATVSCTCNTSGTCSPFTGTGPGGSTSGCAGTCTNCTMKQSASGVNFDSGGYLNLTIVPHIILANEPIPGPFKAMFDVPEVISKIHQFIDGIYQGQPFPEVTQGPNYLEVPSGYLLAIVNIAGRGVVLPIPENAAPAGGATGAAASCSCTNGSCTLKSLGGWPYGATWCEGNCTGTCSLTTSASVGGEITSTIDIYAY